MKSGRPKGLANQAKTDPSHAEKRNSTKGKPRVARVEVRYNDEPLPREALLEYMKKAGRPLLLDALLRVCHVPRARKQALERMLEKLSGDGLALRMRGGGWTLTGDLQNITGRLSMQRQGGGAFVLPQGQERSQEDIYIHPQWLGLAWDGDVVDVLLLPKRHHEGAGLRPEGRVVGIVERAHTSLGAIVRGKFRSLRQVEAISAHTRLPFSFMVDATDLKLPAGRTLNPGDVLNIEPGGNIGPDLYEAKALSFVGDEHDPKVQELIVKAEHGIATEFPYAALEEARQRATLPLEILPLENISPQGSQTGHAPAAKAREDLRSMALVTIDGEDARDFDDAIFVEPHPSGWRLVVAIADVSYYVSPGGALDREAKARGNSFYFPLTVEPMLPQELSNGACSLRPDEDKAVMFADMVFTTQGKPVKSRFGAGIMRSAARLTYTQVEEALAKPATQETSQNTPWLPMLQDAARLAKVLIALRRDQGSLNLDLPEASYVMDSAGKLQGMKRRQRLFSHDLIEAFMVAANEAVARFLTQQKFSLLYRVHPQPSPEKLERLRHSLELSSLVPENPTQGTLAATVAASALPQRKSGRYSSSKSSHSSKSGKYGKKSDQRFLVRKILAEWENSPRKELVHRLVLRAMMQARYTPLLEEHFGLASQCYCHFTSPIRRYADVQVHRALRQALNLNQTSPAGTRSLEKLADQCNVQERLAQTAERDMARRMACLFLEDHEGESFQGTISGVSAFGVFVELEDPLCEGFARVEYMEDFYHYDAERQELRSRNRVLSLGQKVRTVLRHVNITRLEIDLSIKSAI